MLKVLGCIAYQHDLRLLSLAIFICGLACLTTVALLSRAQAARAGQQWLWALVAAAEFGGGIWALHFVAMIAFMPGLTIGYEIRETLLSVVIAISGAFAGFVTMLAVRRRVIAVAGGGALLTAAIGGMHYLGTAAMRLHGRFMLDPVQVGWSIALSAVCAVAAVAVMTDLRSFRRQLASMLLLAAAICTMHFVGMSAMTLVLGPGESLDGVVGSTALVISVAALSIAMLAVSFSLSVMDRHLADRNAREQERLRQLVGVSFEGLLIERDGMILDANERLCDLSGFELNALVGRPASLLNLHPPVPVQANSSKAELQDHDPGSGSLGDANPAIPRARLRTRTGATVPVELLARAISYGGLPANAIAIRDLTATLNNEAAMRRLAHHDALTGLANRVLFDQRVSEVLERALRSRQNAALLCLDLDRFKPVNDLLGHAIGDRLLVAVALRLSALLRSSDTLARLGGDEFAIVLPLSGEAAACVSLARRIVDELAKPFMIDDQRVVIGVSIGIALYPNDGLTGEKLLRCADIAMYRAKEEGRGAFALFEARMDEQLQLRRALERDLRIAVENELLEVHYQPVVSCGSGDIEGFEALLRWNHPTRGSIPPCEFIPLAEDTGLIARLGQWVLQTACAEAVSWDRPLRVAVNLSPAQFRQTDLVEQIAATLQGTGLAPGRLEVEVTEGILIDDPDRAMQLLSRLRQLGVRVSLDDFGTGYSSLSYLRRFPLDKIKIDKSFIDSLGTDRQSAAIVCAVVALAHSLDLSVTAEGVETQEQLEALQGQLCNQVQGYLLGRPMPQSGIVDMVANGTAPAAGLPVPGEFETIAL